MIGLLHVFRLSDVSLCFLHLIIHAEMCLNKMQVCENRCGKIILKNRNFRYCVTSTKL